MVCPCNLDVLKADVGLSLINQKFLPFLIIHQNNIHTFFTHRLQLTPPHQFRWVRLLRLHLPFRFGLGLGFGLSNWVRLLLDWRLRLLFRFRFFTFFWFRFGMVTLITLLLRLGLIPNFCHV
ncbi:P-loop containing nucleoside triphosphatehydrolases superfamily protein [Striga asiatica]|uniref:P-loop containing nucleoside triphosphatehydrolases superfamily protein n=1 Tax=Striga asiatica TaxID=4170 RepID=A0A5A7PDX4_STRAF|nr:P-loop containing nucleoside triphosphatehydrolases superfamily protein [Striga asiatica]